MVIFDRDGNFVKSWGAGLFSFPHAIRIDENDFVWLTDEYHGQFMKFTTDGQLLQTIGVKGQRSDTGVPADEFSSAAYKQVTHGGAPFNLPTDIAFAPGGEMFMTDGYGNARVHKFAADGKYLFSWGEPGTAPGQFNLPHGVWIDRRGRVLIADRENDRVQVFDQAGKLLNVWPTELIGPAFFYVDDDDVVYIPEHNGGMISVLTLDGERLARWGDGPVNRSCHGIWCDFAQGPLRRAARRLGPGAARRQVHAAIAAAQRAGRGPAVRPATGFCAAEAAISQIRAAIARVASERKKRLT